eukprot:3092153-Pyramimonas_sp.AAC.2
MEDEKERDLRGLAQGPDLYAILHISRDASDADVKRAYRCYSLVWRLGLEEGATMRGLLTCCGNPAVDTNLAQTVHPDKHKDPELHATAERNFNRIHEAYEILSDPQKRQLYDSFGFQGLRYGAQVAQQYQTPEEFRKQFEKLLQREVCVYTCEDISKSIALRVRRAILSRPVTASKAARLVKRCG